MLVLWLALCFGAPPTVPAPIKATVGEDYQIEVKVEAGKKGAYAPGFDVKDCLLFRGYSPNEATMTFLVRPKQPRKFIVSFWTVGEGDYAQLVIDAEGAAPIPPTPLPPTPLPNGKLGLTKASRESAAKVSAANKPAEQKALATAQRSLSSAIAAGGVTEPPAILDAWRAGNRAAVLEPAAWAPWGEAMKAALEKAYTDGKLPDKAAWKDAFIEIAVGLEQ